MSISGQCAAALRALLILFHHGKQALSEKCYRHPAKRPQKTLVECYLAERKRLSVIRLSGSLITVIVWQILVVTKVVSHLCKWHNLLESELLNSKKEIGDAITTHCSESDRVAE